MDESRVFFPGYGQMQRIQGGRKRSGRRGKVISPLDWCKAGNAHRRCPRRAHKTIRSVVYLCAPHNWGEPILPEILLTLPAKNCHPQNLLNWRIRRCFLLSSFHRRDRRFWRHRRAERHRDGSFHALSYAECRDRARRSVQLCRLGRHDVHLHRRREDDVWDG